MPEPQPLEPVTAQQTFFIEAQPGRVGEVVDGVKKVAGIPADKLTLLAVIIITLCQLGLLAYGAVVMAPKNAENMNVAGLRALQDLAERSDERLRQERESNRAVTDRRDNRIEEFFKQQGELNRLAREQEFKIVVTLYQSNTAELKELRASIEALIKAIKQGPGEDPSTVPIRPDSLRRSPDSSRPMLAGYCLARW